MSTDINPETTPEAPATEPVQPEAPAEPEAPEGPTAEDWAVWAKAGFDPREMDPYAIKQGYDGWQSLGDRQSRDYMLERLMAGNELPEGMSLQEARQLLQQAAKERSDPWRKLREPEEEYDVADDNPEYYPAQPAVDVDALREAVSGEFERRWAEREAAENERRQQERFEQEFERSLEGVRTKHNLGPQDMSLVAAAAMHKLANSNGQVPVATIAEQAWGELDTWRKSGAGDLLRRQQEETPEVTAPAGPVPSGDKVPTNLDESDALARQTLTG